MMAVVGLHLVLNYMDMLSEKYMCHWPLVYHGFILVHLGVFGFITIKLGIWVVYPWPSPECQRCLLKNRNMKPTTSYQLSISIHFRL
jgi:hypothetical protein